MATDQPVGFQIIDGPSRSALIDALKYAFDENTPHSVIFSLSNGKKIKVLIIGLEHEDSSGFSFNIKLRHDVVLIAGYYNSRTKSGHIII